MQDFEEKDKALTGTYRFHNRVSRMVLVRQLTLWMEKHGISKCREGGWVEGGSRSCMFVLVCIYKKI